MLVIREQQLEALRAAQREAFHRDLLCEGRLRYPAFTAGIGDAALLEIIRSTVDRAESCGLFLSDDIARFVLLIMKIGLDFETRPDMAEVVAILNDPDLVGSQKLDRLEAFAQASGA